jgi:hypothetical protein
MEGKTVYTDVPCEGAQRVDVQPTRGLNKSTGTERIGAEVRAEMHNEQMAQALRPLFGESAQESALRHRRANLTPEQNRQCQALDTELVRLELREKQVRGEELKPTQAALFRARQQFHAGRC